MVKISFIVLFFWTLMLKSMVLFAQDVIISEPDRIVVTTDIDSTVDEIWQVMIDFKNYEKWNEWYRLEGEAKAGASVKALGKSGGGLDLKITKMEENTLCWTDVSWFTNFGLGGWRCRSVAISSDGNGVKFTNHFEYSGPFRFILDLGTRKTVLEGLTLENQNLKAFVEKR